ncbi:MAG: hypothetical protein ILA26_08405 [Methanobrevibacter sp.]|uniref:zinc ribbon domain-containing protein n=1 Tax=Methanobrevibacter sp. TaxID=66852 RepID=UPI001B53BEC6|nr:zinc ribbon domain-containing protein [Methanobrevibacter sp.]MBP3792038.1 hypothetical protein [Methanobrevibacter sp.]
MPVQRCPKCNKILSPQESVCANCGASVNNHDIGRINSIYHTSNISTLLFLLIFFIVALIYGFMGIVPAIIVAVVLIAFLVYTRFIKG